MRMFEYKKIGLLTACFIAFNCYLLTAQIITGAQQINAYLPLLNGKKVGLIVNQTSVINGTHLVDSLQKLGVSITAIFAPEHGFRGDHSAGAKVKSVTDEKTGLPVISLYGKNYKPSAEALSKVDVMIFDIQDVGARFYTYISTLHYAMEACAENNKQMIVLDRPNPNGFYVDGPVLDMKYKSFVGMHPVPIVHGLTVGEYAGMINGQKWLKDSARCNLTVIPMQGYDHNMKYILPVKPSPNLPSTESIALYPSLCLFEGTTYSLGRGTDMPFECVGKPGCKVGSYYFTPKNISGVAENPPQMNKECRGYVLTPFARYELQKEPRIHLKLMIDLYRADTAQSRFFIDFINKLAGNDRFQQQIKAGLSETEIRRSWQPGIESYLAYRKNYLLYTDASLIYTKP
ncbi:MAG: DUF1343 domain-containing protein [Bacteroidota bacterium]